MTEHLVERFQELPERGATQQQMAEVIGVGAKTIC